MKRCLLIICGLAISLGTFAQQPAPVNTVLPALSPCAGEVVVPVYVENLVNAASASLSFRYDTSVLVYSGYQNPEASLADGMLVINASGNTVNAGWISLTPVTLSQGVLFELVFQGTVGTSGLAWDLVNPERCQYTDLDGNILNAVFTDGSVTFRHCLPTITTTAVSYAGCQGGIIVPVNVTNFEEVASFSLKLQYDTALLEYTGFQDVNPGLDVGLLAVNATGGVAAAAWCSVIPVSFGSGTLIGLTFIAAPGSSLLTWDTLIAENCQYTDLDEEIFPAVFNNGTAEVQYCLPTVTTVAGSYQGCPGAFAVPVEVSGLEEAASFSLKLGYDTNFLTYTGFQNVNPMLDVGLLAVSAVAGKVGMAWCSVVPVTINPGMLMELTFTGAPGSGQLVWDTQDPEYCQYTDLEERIFPALFVNGEVAISNCSNISGHVSYMNSFVTPLNNAVVTLWKNGSPAGQAITDAAGHYEFSNLDAGSYEVTASTDKPWNGANAADGLMCLKHFLSMINLTGLHFAAADVDTSDLVNAADALWILRRYVGMISAFPAPDWIFETGTAVLDGTNNAQVDLQALCAGDADGSYIPEARLAPAVSLSENGLLLTETGLVEIPVRLAFAGELGAVSLVLGYNSDALEILEVTSPSDQVTFVYRIDGSQVRLGWYSPLPLAMKAGDAVAMIKARVRSASDIMWELGIESALADGNALTIPGAALEIPRILMENGTFSLDANFPNPFSRTTEISWSMPEAGRVTLKVMNPLGDLIRTLVNENREPGRHRVLFDASGLPDGTYYYQISIQGSGSRFIQTRRMVMID